MIYLTEEKEKFVLYQYLQYFWQKKWYFLIVPLIITVIVVSTVYLLTEDKPYAGQVLFYTGSIDSQELEHPNNVIANFDETMVKNIDVFVSEKGQVKFKLIGDTREELQQYVNEIVNVYSKKLEDAAKLRIDVTNEKLKSVEERVAVLRNSVKTYTEKLSSENLTIAEVEAFTNVLTVTEQELSMQESSAYSMRSDLALFEQPKLLSTSVHEDNNYVKESLAIGIILGLLCTVILLMLMKYIMDARKYYHSS